MHAEEDDHLSSDRVSQNFIRCLKDAVSINYIKFTVAAKIQSSFAIATSKKMKITVLLLIALTIELATSIGKGIVTTVYLY